jgi:hypothetical protein
MDQLTLIIKKKQYSTERKLAVLYLYVYKMETTHTGAVSS